jgi:8-oxo-dGTP diphosphatase
MPNLAHDSSVRRLHRHAPDAPAATVVAPSVFVAVLNDRGKLSLVRQRDSGIRELPGGRVDIGESAVQAAVRETSEESGIQVRITGSVGLYALSGTDGLHLG